MESEIQAYYRSYGRDQLYSIVVRQTLLDKFGAAASELLHRRLQSTEAHVKNVQAEERPNINKDPVVANVHLAIRAAKRLLELDRVIKSSTSEVRTIPQLICVFTCLNTTDSPPFSSPTPIHTCLNTT
eukprot:4819628-Pyramimonas_sp.AAC.1